MSGPGEATVIDEARPGGDPGPGQSRSGRDGPSACRTIGETIRHHAQARPDEPAIVGSDFEQLSYRNLQDEIDRARTVLRGAGYGAGARIAVAIANSAQSVRAIVAVSCSAASIPIDPKLTTPEIERCWSIVRPNAVVLLRGVPSAARSVAERQRLPVIEADFSAGLTLSGPSAGPPASLDEPDPDRPAFILQTSGTTGDPNLVPFSHGNMLACVERLQTWFGLTPGDRCLNVTPVYYSHALTTTVFPPLMTGGSIAFPSNPTSVDVDEWFARLAPTWYSAGPTLHLALVEKAEDLPDARAKTRLRFVSSAGAPLTRDLYDRMQLTLGTSILQHYGSSETAQIASHTAPPNPAKFATCGVPWPGILMIAGEDGRALPTGARGEVCIRGPSVMSGYLNPSSKTLLTADGWYRTGDIGSLDEDGFLTLHGREKEIINRGGEKISPFEIDQALMRHPEVAQAAAFAVPHPRLGEDVGAAVVLAPGATVGASELRAFLTGQLASFKVPRRITILDQLPKGVTGKVQRIRLSEMLRQPAERSGMSEESLQAKLETLWTRILKTDSIGLDDDFFERGGDSLLAMDVSLEMQRLIGRELPESLLFEEPTIREMARRLAEESSKPA